MTDLLPLGTLGGPSEPGSFALKKKVLRLETLYDISRSLAQTRDEISLLEEVVNRAVPVLDAARGFAVTFPEGPSDGALAAVGFKSHPALVDVASDPFILDLCRTRGAASRRDEIVLGERVSTVGGVALRTSRGEVLGVLVVLDREERGGESPSFDEEDRRLLGSLAALVSPSLESARQLQALSVDLDRLREENRSLKGHPEVDRILIGDSAPMRRVKELIARAAASRVNVLVRGESGTGKELVARLLHLESSRKDGPFLALNCAAVPESLLESELFGIERGVATGVEARAGKFELASGGTIFLDEIADAPLAIQAKLLRVLQQREVERVGGRSRIPVDVRVISATHADLREEIRQKRFREDLFYRLRVVEIELPPLRERREDIPRLAAHFLGAIAAREGRPLLRLAREAVSGLLSHPYRGNVRELENLLEGAAALAPRETIDLADLQFGIEASRVRADDSSSLDLQTLEREHVQRVLDSVGGNKTKAAQILGINRRTIYRRFVP